MRPPWRNFAPFLLQLLQLCIPVLATLRFVQLTGRLDYIHTHDELVRRTFTQEAVRLLRTRTQQIAELGDSVEKWRERQLYVREKLKEVFGPLPTERTPLNAQVYSAAFLGAYGPLCSVLNKNSAP
jgi:hypothetical protein